MLFSVNGKILLESMKSESERSLIAIKKKKKNEDTDEKENVTNSIHSIYLFSGLF